MADGAAFAFALPVNALELRVAAWNLEHLDDANGAGCVGRADSDYAAVAERIDALGADVIAFQEVENAAAAQRVFDAERWSVEVSSRPSTGYAFACRGRPEGRLGHLASGIAVREGLEYTRNADVSALAAGSRFRRWGTDVTVARDGQSLRVLSVHLKSGCWGADQDDNASAASSCATLREQVEEVVAWIADRRSEDQAFIVAGDFNRRLAIPDDWAWALLTEDAPARSLPTAGRISRCDARYPEFIDHLVFDAPAGLSMALGSFEEGERSDPHPDHCAVSRRACVRDSALSRRSRVPPFTARFGASLAPHSDRAHTKAGASCSLETLLRTPFARRGRCLVVALRRSFAVSTSSMNRRTVKGAECSRRVMRP